MDQSPQPPLLARLRPASSRGLLGCALLYAAGYLAYIAAVMPVTTRADYVYHLHLMSRWWEQGQFLELFCWLFEVQSGHPIVPSRILALINFVFFSYSATLSNVIAVATLALAVGAVLWIYWRLLPEELTRSASMLVGALLLLNPTFYEVFSYSEAVPPLFLSTPLMCLSTYLIYRASLDGFAGPRSTALLTASVVLALLCSLTNGAGLMVFPALITLVFFAFWLGPTRPSEGPARRRVVLAIVACALLAGLFRVLPHEFGSVDRPPVNLLGSVQYFFALTISPLLQKPAPRAAALGLPWCILLAHVGYLSFKHDRERFPLWAAWVVFGLVSAAAISLTRAGREVVVPSRYAVYVLPLYLGFAPAFVTVLGKELSQRHKVALALVSVPLLGFAAPEIVNSLQANQAKYDAINQETAAFTRGAPLNRVDCVYRWNGGLPVAAWLIETLPRFKRLGLASEVMGDYRIPSDEFLIELGLTREQLAGSSAGNSEAVGYTGHVGAHPKPDWVGSYPPGHDVERFGDSPGFAAGDFEFVTFRGVALDHPLWVFAVDRLGRVMCVSKPMPSNYTSGPEAGGDPGSEGYFDFTCPMTRGSFAPPYSVVAYRSRGQWAKLPLRPH